MNETNPTGASRSAPSIVARWMAIVLAGVCTVVIIVNLGTAGATNRVAGRFVLPLGCLLTSLSTLIGRRDRARMALLIGGASSLVAAVDSTF